MTFDSLFLIHYVQNLHPTVGVPIFWTVIKTIMVFARRMNETQQSIDFDNISHLFLAASFCQLIILRYFCKCILQLISTVARINVMCFCSTLLIEGFIYKMISWQKYLARNRCDIVIIWIRVCFREVRIWSPLNNYCCSSYLILSFKWYYRLMMKILIFFRIVLRPL